MLQPTKEFLVPHQPVLLAEALQVAVYRDNILGAFDNLENSDTAHFKSFPLESTKKALNTRDGSTWYLANRFYGRGTLGVQAVPEDDRDLTVLLRSRDSAVMAPNGLSYLLDRDGNRIYLDLDYMRDPADLAWKRSSGSRLDLVNRAARLLGIVAPPVISVEGPQMNVNMAEEAAFDLANILTDLSYIAPNYSPMKPLGSIKG
jgi:hypothetical protein